MPEADLKAKFGHSVEGDIVARNQRDLACSARLLGGAAEHSHGGWARLEGRGRRRRAGHEEAGGRAAQENVETLKSQGKKALSALSDGACNVVSSAVKELQQNPEHFVVKTAASLLLMSKLKAALQPRSFKAIRLSGAESSAFDKLLAFTQSQTDRLAKGVAMTFKGIKVVARRGETAESIAFRFREAAASKNMMFVE